MRSCASAVRPKDADADGTSTAQLRDEVAICPTDVGKHGAHRLQGRRRVGRQAAAEDRGDHRGPTQGRRGPRQGLCERPLPHGHLHAGWSRSRRVRLCARGSLHTHTCTNAQGLTRAH
eukprot:2053135-Prymnesium_polylepis.1